MNLLEVSPQHQRNPNMDYLDRSDPVYIGRVVSAMVSVNRFKHSYLGNSDVMAVD